MEQSTVKSVIVRFKAGTTEEEKSLVYNTLNKIQELDPQREISTLDDWKIQIKQLTKIEVDAIAEVEEKPLIIKALDTEKEELESVRNMVYMHLATKDRRKATEALTVEAERRFKIYTIRSDKNNEMWVYDDGIYVPQGSTYVKEMCRRILGDAQSSQLINEVLFKIQSDTYITQEEFFDSEEIDEIPVENGVLNVMTKQLSEFTPEKIFFSKLPVEYDPLKDCPNFKQHLTTVLKFPEDIKVMQEIFGSCLYKEYTWERAFMFIGSGRNGKTKTVEVLKHLLGPQNCTSITLQALEEHEGGVNFAIGALHKKLVNIAEDIGSRTIKDTSIFKSLTGRGYITAQRKFLEPIYFTNYAKLVFCANQVPYAYDDSDAWWMRWIPIEFPYKFVKKEEYDVLSEEDKKLCKIGDPNIIDSLTTPEELSGILNWSLDGLARLEKQKDFSFSKNAEAVRTFMLRKSSSLAAFLIDCTAEQWDGHIEKEEFRQEYNLYCQFHKTKPLSDKIVRDVLMSKGIGEERKREQDEQKAYWYGMVFKLSKPSELSEGFLTYRQKRKSALGVKKAYSANSPYSPFIPGAENSALVKITEETIESGVNSKFSEKPIRNDDSLIEFIKLQNSKNILPDFLAIQEACDPIFSVQLESRLVKLREMGILFESQPDQWRVL